MAIIPRAKTNLSILTVHEREAEVKRIHGEEEELVDEMGQRSDRKALPTVRAYVKEQETESKLKEQQDLEKLRLLSKNKIHYQRYLIAILYRFVKEESIPKKYRLVVDSSDLGIAVGIEGTNLLRAFKLSGIPFYDINACKTVAVQIGNTVAKFEGYVHTSKGGVVLPDSLDKKTYVKEQ